MFGFKHIDESIEEEDIFTVEMWMVEHAMPVVAVKFKVMLHDSFHKTDILTFIYMHVHIVQLVLVINCHAMLNCLFMLTFIYTWVSCQYKGTE